MCDPVTLGIAALSGGMALFGNKGGNAPPPVVRPEAPPANTKAPDALVKIGDGAKPTDNTSTPQYDGFTNKRTFGTPLSGLGRGGLSL